MTIEVRYQSRTGNTRKIAEAIAEAVGVKAKRIDAPLREPVELMFLGGGVYGGSAHRKIKRFLKDVTAFQVENIAVFCTSAGPETIYSGVKSILELGSTALLEEHFHAPGRFLHLNRSRPDESDLDGAAEYALKTVKSFEDARR